VEKNIYASKKFEKLRPVDSLPVRTADFNLHEHERKGPVSLVGRKMSVKG